MISASSVALAGREHTEYEMDVAATPVAPVLVLVDGGDNDAAAALRQAQDTWEYELDLLGPSPSSDELAALLARAPDPGADTVHFVRGYLAHVELSR